MAQVCVQCGGQHPRYMCPKTSIGFDNALRILFAGEYKPLSSYDLPPEEVDKLIHAYNMFQWLDLDTMNITKAQIVWAQAQNEGDPMTWFEAVDFAMRTEDGA